jgi:tetratricopeptide (TPR) repeat protein
VALRAAVLTHETPFSYSKLEFLGVDHPLQAATLHEIAKIHMKKGRARKATSICDTVLEIRKESLSEWHIDYARALATKGSSLSMRGEFEESTSCLEEALRVAKQSVFTRRSQKSNSKLGCSVCASASLVKPGKLLRPLPRFFARLILMKITQGCSDQWTCWIVLSVTRNCMSRNI